MPPSSSTSTIATTAQVGVSTPLLHESRLGRKMMDAESSKLEFSPPLYYKLKLPEHISLTKHFLPFESPKHIGLIHKPLPPLESTQHLDLIHNFLSPSELPRHMRLIHKSLPPLESSQQIGFIEIGSFYDILSALELARDINLIHKSLLPLESPQQIGLIHDFLPPEVMLALEALGYMAMKDVKPFSEVLDTMKVFSIMLCVAETSSRVPNEVLSSELKKSGFPLWQRLHKYNWISAYREQGKILREKISKDFADSDIDSAIDRYHILGKYYTRYKGVPRCASLEPQKDSVIKYPSLQAVIDFLKENSSVPEINTVLPILYILAGQPDSAIEFYEGKSTMDGHDKHNLGTIYLLEKQNFQMARKYWDLDTCSSSLATQYNLGMTYLYEKGWKEASDCFRPITVFMDSILHASQDSPVAFIDTIVIQRSLNNLGYCLYYGKDDFREALGYFERAAALKPLTGANDGSSNRLYLTDKQLDTIQPIREREEHKHFHNIIGKSEVMQEVFSMIKKASQTDFYVLITGETGTGKDLAARAIHEMSNRRDKPFIVQNCSAIPEELVDDTLFGHEKGAFTGADYPKKGIFEQAHDGILFLDELGIMSVRLQTKILRIIEDGEVKRIGSEVDPKKVDVRVISATNEDLDEAVKDKRFRMDLYHRINTIQIHIPPLRERKEDISLLHDHFIDLYSGPDGEVRGISTNAKIMLANYSWPGNVRQLMNAIRSAITTTEGAMIRVCDLPDEIQNEKNEDTEKEMILHTLKTNHGNVSAAARDLEWNISKLKRRIKKYGIDPKEFKPAK